MRALLLVIALGACASRGARPAAMPAASPAAAVVAVQPTEVEPQWSEAMTRLEDVDHDGLDDRVMVFPPLRVGDRELAGFRDLPPAVVAHALPGGGYTHDDAVARTTLRALCPASPPVRAYDETRDAIDELGRAPYLEALLLDAYCRRVWGASLAEARAYVRATVQGSASALFPADAVTAIEEALGTLPVVRRLEPLAPPAWPVFPQAPADRGGAVGAPPVSPRCARVRQDRARLSRQVDAWVTAQAREEGNPVMLPGLADDRDCLATPQGVWALTVQGLTFHSEAELRIAATESLVWRPSGAARAPTPRTFPLEANWHSSRWSALEAVYDYDGDGLPEVIVRHDGWAFESHADRTRAVYTVADGTVRVYAPAADFRQVDGLVDADRDGRPDLVLPSPWQVTDDCGLAGIDHPGPSRLAHARADGRFATDDDAARAWLRAQCAPTASSDSATDVHDVACARLAGLEPEALVAALQRRAPAGPQRHVRAVRDGLCLTFQQLALQALVPLPAGP
jgi:hypothetical protein